MRTTRALTRFDLLVGYMEWLHRKGLLDEHALNSFLTADFKADDYVSVYCTETGYDTAMRNEEVTAAGEYDIVIDFSEWLDDNDQDIMAAPCDPTSEESHDELVRAFLKTLEEPTGEPQHQCEAFAGQHPLRWCGA